MALIDKGGFIHSRGAMGRKAIADTRQLVSKSGKTGNKKYAVTLSGQPDPTAGSGATKEFKRNTQVSGLDKRASNMTTATTEYDTGEELHKLFSTAADPKMCGNCYEQSHIAGYLLAKDHNVPTADIFIGTISDPGDHVFCLVTENGVPFAPFQPTTLSAAVTKPEARKWLVVDPWLHVLSTFNSYLKAAVERCKLWSAQGKRIYWGATKNDKSTVAQGPGWYPPDGDYATYFASSTVTIKPFRKAKKIGGHRG